MSDVPPGSLRYVEVGGKEIMAANEDGEVYAMDDRCGHMNAPMHMGELEGMIETCPLYGARFDVTTRNHQTDGKLGGMTGAIAGRTKMCKLMGTIRTMDTSTYPVVVEEGRVCAVLGWPGS